jgi:hypothetical protein
VAVKGALMQAGVKGGVFSKAAPRARGRG